MPGISIISPRYNEEENVEACHSALVALFGPEGPLTGGRTSSVIPRAVRRTPVVVERERININSPPASATRRTQSSRD